MPRRVTSGDSGSIGKTSHVECLEPGVIDNCREIRDLRVQAEVADFALRRTDAATVEPDGQPVRRQLFPVGALPGTVESL
jgi:hypothetical protein